MRGSRELALTRGDAQVERGDVVGLGEGGGDGGFVAETEEEAEVVGGVVGPDGRGAGGEGLGGVGDGGQGGVVDVDAVLGVFGGVAGFGDDDGDGVADEAGGVLGEQAVGRAGHGGAVGAVALDGGF